MDGDDDDEPDTQGILHGWEQMSYLSSNTMIFTQNLHKIATFILPISHFHPIMPFIHMA
jgi:hypothetical protein